MKATALAINVFLVAFGGSKAFMQSRMLNNQQISPMLTTKPLVSRTSIRMSDVDSEEKVDVEEDNAPRRPQLKRKANELVNSNGVSYAPWMELTVMTDADMERIQRERDERTKKKNLEGALLYDPQAGELSGVGLTYRMVGDEIELNWATDDEANNVGFIVQKRKGKTNDWQTIASYETWQPLNSQGPEGGSYSYLDTDSEPGAWVYRISACDTAGGRSDICQCLVEVQTEGERKAAQIAVAGFVAIAAIAVVAGFLADPMQ